MQKEVKLVLTGFEMLEKENKELKKILTIFINPHTPPSKQFFKKKFSRDSKKLGAPVGHKGATRKLLQPTETVKHFLTKCPKCDNVLDKPFDFEERINRRNVYQNVLYARPGA